MCYVKRHVQVFSDELHISEKESIRRYYVEKAAVVFFCGVPLYETKRILVPAHENDLKNSWDKQS